MPAPQAGEPSGEPLLDFHADMVRLRRECPWKREQTHRSLARYLQEEAHEVLEAIDTGDTDHLREELGDLLLQVYFHAVIAEEAGAFTLDDVARGIAEKMHQRNPHVFDAEWVRRFLAELDCQRFRWRQFGGQEVSALDCMTASSLSALLQVAAGDDWNASFGGDAVGKALIRFRA